MSLREWLLSVLPNRPRFDCGGIAHDKELVNDHCEEERVAPDDLRDDV